MKRQWARTNLVLETLLSKTFLWPCLKIRNCRWLFQSSTEIVKYEYFVLPHKTKLPFTDQFVWEPQCWISYWTPVSFNIPSSVMHSEYHATKPNLAWPTAYPINYPMVARVTRESSVALQQEYLALWQELKLLLSQFTFNEFRIFHKFTVDNKMKTKLKSNEFEPCDRYCSHDER